jgi:regulator of sigma E protease
MHLNTVLLMSSGLTKGLQLFAGLSILIILHEFGHFFFARLFKTRVEKFYLFFDFLFPFSSVLNFALFKKKKGDTEYGIGWFPLGGYVKISGMVDESMDKAALALPPEPWEYRSKKAWQRLFIMLGGIIMNVLTAIVLYMFIFGVWGEEYLPVKNATYGIATDSLARSIGLQDGDMITSIDGKPVKRFERIIPDIIISGAETIGIERDGKPITINIPSGTIHSIITTDAKNEFIAPRFPIGVDSVLKTGDDGKITEAFTMGFQAGDSIIAINNQPVRFFNEFEDALKKFVGQAISVVVVRNGKIDTLRGTDPKSMVLGFKTNGAKYVKKIEVKYSPLEAMGRGFGYTFEKVKDYYLQFRLILVSKEVKANESVGGLYSFGKIFPGVFDWKAFLSMVAFISVILAFMNLLPIPGLDGGYVIFLLWELITGRKVSEKVMERATTVGLVLLLALMLYANGLDIFRYFKR